jgi:hypothetical protein
LTGSDEWVELKGTSACRNIWDDRAQLEEITIINPSDDMRTGALALRIYNRPTREWNLYWANSGSPTVGPPEVGRFENGRGEFFARNSFRGTEIMVRYLWTDLSSGSPRFEQAFSTDDGKTWEPNWIALRTRLVARR